MKNNKITCPCKRVKCERYGNGNACKNYHHTSIKKPFTTCERIKTKEKREENKEKNKE